MLLSVLGLLLALGLLVVVTMRGMSLFLATPVCALVIALTSDLALLPPLAGDKGNMVDLYMAGFSGFIASWFFMFLLGALFGKMMEDSGAAERIALWVMDRIGARHAAMGVVAACAILTYGGVSVFVVAFSVYPTALVLFRAADLPRRFIPGCLAFGSVTFTMTTAGSPEIQNWIPIQFLNTSPWAAWEASFVTAAFMAVTGTWLLNRLLRRARESGERFAARPGDPEATGRDLPPVWRAFLGPATVLAVSFSLHARLGTSALIVSLLAGVLVVGGFCWRTRQNPGVALSQGALGALVAIGNTAAVVGFGAVAKNAPAFISGVEWLTSTGGGGVTGAALAVAVICAITGSASGGQAVALPLLAPGFLASGVDPNQLHRAVAIASGGLDSLPHNGYVVTTIRAICGESHRDAYGPVGWLTVVIPFLGLWVCLLLFGLGL